MARWLDLPRLAGADPSVGTNHNLPPQPRGADDLSGGSLRPRVDSPELRPGRQDSFSQPKETDHGQSEKEDRPEGEEGHCPQAGCHQGPRKVNYTLTQAIDRAKDLSGELKASRAHEADCVADHEAKLRIAEIAAEAHEKATAHCIALEAEREQLADHIAALVRKVGEPLDLETDSNLQKVQNASDLALQHASDCAVHNEPAFAAGPCDCGAAEGSNIRVTYNSIFTEGADFQAQALQNGAAKIGQAFDEATR